MGNTTSNIHSSLPQGPSFVSLFKDWLKAQVAELEDSDSDELKLPEEENSDDELDKNPTDSPLDHKKKVLENVRWDSKKTAIFITIWDGEAQIASGDWSLNYDCEFWEKRGRDEDFREKARNVIRKEWFPELKLMIEKELLKAEVSQLQAKLEAVKARLKGWIRLVKK